MSWYLLDMETCIVHYCSLGHSEDFCSKCGHLQIHCITSDDFQGHNSHKYLLDLRLSRGANEKGNLHSEFKGE